MSSSTIKAPHKFISPYVKDDKNLGEEKIIVFSTEGGGEPKILGTFPG